MSRRQGLPGRRNGAGRVDRALWGPAPDDWSSADIGHRVLGATAAAELGYGRDSATFTVIDPNERLPSSDRWVLRPVPPLGLADSCWIEAEPGSSAPVTELTTYVFTNAVPDPTVRPFRRAHELAADPVADYAHRPTAYLAPLLAEIALYRSLGTSTGQLMLIGATEVLCLVGLAACSGVPGGIALWVAVDEPETLGLALRSSARQAAVLGLLLLASAPLAWGLVSRRSVSARLRD